MISYIGGKSRISKFIIPHIPKDIEVFVECFGGMMWVFFNMDLKDYPNLKTVVYNDFNKLNANLFRCSKQYDRLLRELKEYPRQEYHNPITPPFYAELFDMCQKDVFDPNLVIPDEPDFEIAAKYIYVLCQIFSGSRPEKSKYMDYKGKYRCKVDIFEDKLRHPKFREHLDKITVIENKDFEEITETYDSLSTYYYDDPPYRFTENYYSNHIFEAETHERLANCLKKIKGKFGLSYYEFPQLLEWYPEPTYHWESKGFAKAAAAKEGIKQNIGTELLIMNY